MNRLLPTVVMAVIVMSPAEAAQLGNDTFTLTAAQSTMAVEVTVPPSEAKSGLRIEVFSSATNQPLTVTARNPRGRIRSLSGAGRVTLMISSDDMDSRPGFPLTFRIEVGVAGGLLPGVTAVNGQLAVWSGADVRPPPIPMLQQKATQQPRPEPQPTNPASNSLLKTIPPGTP